MLIEILGVIFFLIFFIGLSFFISVPLDGALVRLRANYSPIRLRLDSEDGLEPPTGLAATSYFGMFVRVKRIEGWSGLFKGAWPTFLTTLFVSSTLAPFIGTSSGYRHGSYSPPTHSLVVLTLVYGAILSFVLIPFRILKNRSITTQHKLSFFGFRKALRVLFTERERHNPLILFLTPGILFTQMLYTVLVVFGLGFLRRFLLSAAIIEYVKDIRSAVPLIIYLGAAMASIIILTPLEVILVRLSIQRNYGENEAPTETPEYAGIEEDVIEVRNDEEDPYYGLFDCTRKIINEEGWRALYCGWWLTLLGTTLTAFGA